MKQNFGAKPWIYPQPVLMIGTYDEKGVPDIMNAAWGGVGDDTQIFLCISPEHKTTENILKKKEFTVSIGVEKYVKECDYLGIVSGNDVPDKVAKSGLNVTKAEFVDAPVIEELPICMECRLISYEPEHCHLFGEIINTSVDDSDMTEGKIDSEKLRAISYDITGHNYLVVGSSVGKAFSDGLKIGK